MERILLIEDDDILAEGVKMNLSLAGFTAESVSDLKEGEKRLDTEAWDLLLLDVNLPDGDGFSFARKVRSIQDIPVIFLTAKDMDEDMMIGFESGADDYITKPFLPPELVLRISAILKRAYQFGKESGTEDVSVLCLGECQVLFDYGTVRRGEKETPLTAKELALLKKLNENRGKIVTFDALCSAAWGDSYYGYENTLMVHIRHLREKIEEDPSHPRWLLTARGLGYRLAADKGERR